MYELLEIHKKNIVLVGKYASQIEGVISFYNELNKVDETWIYKDLKLNKGEVEKVRFNYARKKNGSYTLVLRKIKR